MKKIGVECTSASVIGKRSYQEDKYVLSAGDYGWLIAIMDGHNGAQTSIYCCDNLVETFSKTNSLFETVRILNDKTKNFESGSTLSIVHIPKDAQVANVAILGDSPVIIRSKNGVINISPEHNVRTNLLEREAAIKRGGVYSAGHIYDDRLQYGLQMSRALGDSYLDNILNREPDVYTIELAEESFVIAVSDGVIDPGHENSKMQIDRIVKLVEQGADAKKLVEDALARQTKDNATAIVWQRKK